MLSIWNTPLEDTTEVGGTTATSTTAVEVNITANLAGIRNDAAAKASAANLEDTNATAGDNSTAFIDDISNVSKEFTNIIQKIADARAENGAEQQRVTTSYNLHSQNLVNLEAARGRIMDTDGIGIHPLRST